MKQLIEADHTKAIQAIALKKSERNSLIRRKYQYLQLSNFVMASRMDMEIQRKNKLLQFLFDKGSFLKNLLAEAQTGQIT